MRSCLVYEQARRRGTADTDGTLYTQASLTARGGRCFRRQDLASARICVTLALLCLSGTRLWYAVQFGGVWAPVAMEVMLLLLAAFLLFRAAEKRAGAAGASIFLNPLLALETTVSVYRDSVVLESGREKILEYWTEFQRCFETPRYFVAAAGATVLMGAG